MFFALGAACQWERATKSGVRSATKSGTPFGVLVALCMETGRNIHAPEREMQEIQRCGLLDFIVSVRIHLVCGGRSVQEQLGCLMQVLLRPLALKQQSRCMVALC